MPAMLFNELPRVTALDHVIKLPSTLLFPVQFGQSKTIRETSNIGFSGELLFKFPPELLLMILSQLDPADLFALCMTSKALEYFVTSYAPTLCNALILRDFADAAAIMESRILNGWLVPTHPVIEVEERRVCDSRRKCCKSCGHRAVRGTRARHPRQTPALRRLSSPGPHYLRFLTQYQLYVRVSNQMHLKSCEKAVDPKTKKIETPEAMELVERSKATLQSRIGCYAVRRFLKDSLYLENEKDLGPEEVDVMFIRTNLMSSGLIGRAIDALGRKATTTGQ